MAFCGNRVSSVQDCKQTEVEEEHGVVKSTVNRYQNEEKDGMIFAKDEIGPNKEDCAFVLKEQYWRWVAVKEKKKPKDHHVIFAKSDSSTSPNTLRVRGMFDLELAKEFFATNGMRIGVFNTEHIFDNDLKFVMKWVKPSHKCIFNEHIKNEIRGSKITAKIISSFSQYVNMGGWRIRVVRAFLMEGGPEEIGIEPYVSCDEWFSWNTLLEPDTFRIHRKLVTALIHYSYVYSGGSFVLSHVKGEIDEEEMIVTLLLPALISAHRGSQGCQDLGTLKSFEKYHICNSICRHLPQISDVKKFSKPGLVFEAIEE